MWTLTKLIFKSLRLNKRQYMSPNSASAEEKYYVNFDIYKCKKPFINKIYTFAT